MLKAIILVGGPMKGTRFRPLSLELPKPLFPVAGFPIIYHHIEACSQVPGLREILVIGFYQPNEALNRFINQSQLEFQIQIRYLQEYTALGTAGGIYHFRDQILTGNPDMFFVMNADVCGDFPLCDMVEFHQQRCPKAKIFSTLEVTFKKNLEDNYNFDFQTPSKEVIRLEQDVFIPLASSGKLFVFPSTRFWSQIKSAGAAVYANRHYLTIYQRTHPERLAKNGEGQPRIIGDVFIHPTAYVHPTAVLGPNVTIGRNVTVGEGVRVRETIVLEGANLQVRSPNIHPKSISV
ncbi:mannose-1-phosphate guanyltransferase alpha [Plakobranchus ocellatus]|uniref:Mannose-1-phosphate guanyltransferase alpha n=1 Tax=Plakobranchus ocellatus TaxID=259542 RepID=A0AAV4CL94_9GAST|nr:mannose-1-phosphate guanyltransferase alpha [Plakobranchus ocellatus]